MRRFLSSCSSIGAVIWAVLCNFISVSLLHLSHPWNSILFSPFLFLFYPRLISGTHIISRMSVRLAYPVLSPVPSLFPSQIELLVSAFRSSLSPCTKTLSALTSCQSTQCYTFNHAVCRSPSSVSREGLVYPLVDTASLVSLHSILHEFLPLVQLA